MTDLQLSIRQYLRDLLGVEIRLTPWEASRNLPAFLVERYLFLHGQIFNQPVLFLLDLADDEESPGNIRKHVARIRPETDWPVIYVRERVTSYNRKRLIEQRVPFLVPGNQLYLPDLGIDLREHFLRKTKPRPQFRPATQAVFIHMLLRESHDPITNAELAKHLSYSGMTIGRAFDDLVAVELAHVQRVGREETLALAGPRRELWNRAESLLKSPVKGRHFMKARDSLELGPKAGLSALATYTMIADHRDPVVAMTREQQTALQQQH
ncbi:MAG TPA: hypothetical protein PKA37_02230, partial [Planctomycetota bacterium]|nr:hypothetical protein [Planctomycetota bacterium]